jgi:hypothetical protein
MIDFQKLSFFEDCDWEKWPRWGILSAKTRMVNA